MAQAPSHTTLERKIRLIFGLMILLIIISALFWPWYQMEALVGVQDRVSAREMARAAWLTLHMPTLSGDITREQIDELAAKAPLAAKSGTEQPRIITLNPTPGKHAGLPQDAVEKHWLEQFAAERDLPFREDRPQFDKSGPIYYRYAYPLRATAACIDCHGTADPSLKSGDLLGAIVVAFPTEEARLQIKINRAILIGAAFITAILGMLAFYGVVRLVIVQPVTHLKRVADRVSEGNFHVRADLQTGDEFEALSRSFNRMLQRLEASREELRRANQSLDQKLEELARANVSLFEMNQVKTKFLTTMSHELRTPLNGVLGFADLLEENEAIRNDPKMARYVTNIQSSGRLLLDIINDILDLAKIEAGKMEAKLGQVSPLDLCETTMAMVRPMVGPKDLRLELEVAPDCPIMTTDANKLQQILFNLLSNAVKFTAAGVVHLTARPLDAQTILFQVSDSGPGLSAAQQKIIFDRFSQVDSGHTRQYGGTGLGLSIVKELVDLLGGDVAVQSEPGQGATFNVTLPIVCTPREVLVGEVVVTHVEPRPQPKEPATTKAPEPVTSDDTIVAAEVETDQLKPDAGTTPPAPPAEDQPNQS
jgi:signal transduction histidine kinase